MALPSTPAFLAYQIEFSNLLDSLSATEKMNLGRLKIVIPWCMQSVNWPMLKAATRFWHSRCHVFRFGLDELGPTFEEFSVITGYPLLSPPIIVDQRRRSRDVLTEFLGLPTAQARRVTPGGCIDLMSIVRLFSQCHEADHTYSRHRLHAVTLCLTSFLLLVTGAELADSSVVHIAAGIAAGYSPVPVILAETLNGLDACQEDPEAFMRGSPMLLSIWLMEHFQLVVPPTRALAIPDRFFDRFLIDLGMETVSQWTRWFAKDGISQIRWFVPWWQLGYPISPVVPLSYVPLIGMRMTSHYSPYRLMRQYHLAQGTLEYDEHPQGANVLTRTAAESWLSLWRLWQMGTSEIPWEREITVPVSSIYLEWFWEDTCQEMWSNVYRHFRAEDEDGKRAIFQRYRRLEQRREMGVDNGEFGDV